MSALPSDAPKHTLQATETSLHVTLVNTNNTLHLAAGNVSPPLATVVTGLNSVKMLTAKLCKSVTVFHWRGFKHWDIQQPAAKAKS